MIKAILFDFDDTLINSLETKTEALKLTGKKHFGLNLKADEIKKHWGKPFEKFIKDLFYQVENVEQVFEKYAIEREKFPASAFKGTVGTLKKLSKGYLLGIITSHTRKFINKDLKLAKIPENLFFIIQCQEESPAHKPSPRVFDLVLKKLKTKKIKKNEIIYVGDHLFDFYAARDAKIQFYGLPDRTTTKKEFQKNGAKILNKFSDLINIVNLS